MGDRQCCFARLSRGFGGRGVNSGKLKVAYASCSRTLFVIDTDVQVPARSEATPLKSAKELQGAESTVANLGWNPPQVQRRGGCL